MSTAVTEGATPVPEALPWYTVQPAVSVTVAGGADTSATAPTGTVGIRAAIPPSASAAASTTTGTGADLVRRTDGAMAGEAIDAPSRVGCEDR